MFHLLLALYIIAFGIAIGPLIVCFFLFRKTGNPGYLELNAIMIGGTLLLVSDGVKTYSSAALGSVSPSMVFSALACTIVGSGLMQWSIPTLSYRVVRKPVTRRIATLRILLMLAVMALGGAKELNPSPAFPALHGFLTAAAYCGYAVFLIVNFKRIEDQGLRAMTRGMFILLCVLLPLMAAQGAIESLLKLPSELGDAPFTQLLFQIAACCLSIYCAVRYIFSSTPQAPGTVPHGFSDRFGISEREREIIALVIQGLSNQQIADNLYISAQTVKNHVYHIYRKTGVANKVQLLNLMQGVQGE